MSVSDGDAARVALVTKDQEFGDGLREWCARSEPALTVTIAVASWGDLLHDPGFPTDVVVLDAASSIRKPVVSRVRTFRAAGSAVIVIVAADDIGDPQPAIAAGAFCVLRKGVPFGLIGEMARAAVGLPV